jgi:hypothetical protein
MCTYILQKLGLLSSVFALHSIFSVPIYCTYLVQKLGLLKTKTKNHNETKSNEILIVETANPNLDSGNWRRL